MKNIKVLYILMLMMLGFTACNSDDIMPNDAQNGNAGAVIRFTLGGSAKKAAASRATIPAEGKETEVNSLLAVFFDTHKGFYKTVEASPAGGDAYEVLVEDDATYDIYFIANANENLKKQLEEIPDTTQAINARYIFRKIIADQELTADNDFLMICSTPKRTSTTLTKTEDIGTVTLGRLLLRFDIVNKAEGITVNSVTFNKRAVKSSLFHNNYMPVDLEGLYETKVYSDLNLEGKADGSAALKQTIYSYRNISLDADSISTFTIEYTENGTTRTHEVKFTDPTAPAGTPLALHTNRLFTITLTKAYKLNFEVSVDDWDEATTFNEKELPIGLPESVQQELNEKLLVYDLFAEHNVASISDDKIVTFMNPTVLNNDFPRESYIQSQRLASLGLLANGAVVTDEEGNKYRMPTLGEFQLLTPYDKNHVANSTDPDGVWSHPYFASSQKFMDTPFTEEVYLKNDGTTNYPFIPAEIEDNDVAFSGISQLKLGQQSKKIYIGADGSACDEDNDTITYTYTRYACYGIRFQGSSQYSAYRWEPYNKDENGVYYLSIKIKALPEDFALDVYDITDNYAFWKDGWFEIRLYYSGTYHSDNPDVKQSANNAFILSSTKKSANSYYYISSNFTSVSMNSVSYAYLPIRLVKVKETAAE